MRTAPMGPSKGIPDSIRAAEAALMAMTSWGFSWSAPITVPTTWVSLRYPGANDGRSGRSIRRQVRMAWSLGRPSRRKNEPGILPAAYIRSSMSTVSGKKSMPSRTPLSALAVTSTKVSPIRPMTAPWDWGASRPVSNDRVLSVPLIGPDTEMASAMVAPSASAVSGRRRRASSQWSGTRNALTDPSSPRLAADRRSPPPAWLWDVLRLRLLLAAQAELGDDLAVTLDVVVLHVVEQPPPTTDQLHQAPSGVMIALVNLEV